MKKRKSIQFLTILLGILLVFTPSLSSLASDTETSSPIKYAQVNGYLYSYQGFTSVSKTSTSSTQPIRVNARGEVKVQQGKQAPAGYIQISTYLYRSDTQGEYLSKFGWSTNSATTSHFICSTPYISQPEGYEYHSKLTARFMTSSGSYSDPYYSEITPSAGINALSTNFEINESGLTFGSNYYSISTETTPDLVSVIGNNGLKGYVYAEDIAMNDNLAYTLMQAVSEGENYYTIPVYEEDGTTVIDTFNIDFIPN